MYEAASENNRLLGQKYEYRKDTVYIAIIIYILVAIIKQKLKSNYSCYETLQILKDSLLDKIQLNQLLQQYNNPDTK